MVLFCLKPSSSGVNTTATKSATKLGKKLKKKGKILVEMQEHEPLVANLLERQDSAAHEALTQHHDKTRRFRLGLKLPGIIGENEAAMVLEQAGPEAPCPARTISLEKKAFPSCDALELRYFLHGAADQRWARFFEEQRDFLPFEAHG